MVPPYSPKRAMDRVLVPRRCGRCLLGPLAHRFPVVVVASETLAHASAMMPAMVTMDTVEHPDLVRGEDLSPLHLHLGFLVHELELKAVQLLLLGEEGCPIRLGIGGELPHLDPLHLDVIPEVVGICPEDLPQLPHLPYLFLGEVKPGT